MSNCDIPLFTKMQLLVCFFFSFSFVGIADESLGEIEESKTGRHWQKLSCGQVCLRQNSVPPREDCEGWWLSGCHSSVAEHWQLKPYRIHGLSATG